MLSAVLLATLMTAPPVAHETAPAVVAHDTAPAVVAHDPVFEHIRTANRHVRRIVADVAAKSPTFATLLERLDQTNVAVYLQFVADLPRPRYGQLHFLGASDGFRYVRVQIRAGLPLDQLAASLAHELRHALEVGEHPEVVCDETMEELYRRIGRRHSQRQFETSEAASTGRKVREELLGS